MSTVSAATTTTTTARLASPHAADLRALASGGGPQVSIYLPTHSGPLPARQDLQRLAQLAARAEQLLLERYAADPETPEALDGVSALSSLRGLVASLTSLPPRAAGVALFAASDLSRAFKLHVSPREAVVVGEHFFLRPLLDSLHDDVRSYGLALSLNSVRLLDCDEQGAVRVVGGRVPASLQDALGYTEFDTGVQMHSANPRALGSRSAVVHGHGGRDSDGFDDDLRNFLHRVADGLRHLPDRLGRPIVVASVREHFDLLAQVASDLDLLYADTGNADHLTDLEVGEFCQGVAERALRLRHRQELAETLEGPGRGASNVLEEILPAADSGRVRTLFLARGAEIRGRYDAARQSLERSDPSSPQEWDLLDVAARLTLERGGEIVTLGAADFPAGRVAVARHRY